MELSKWKWFIFRQKYRFDMGQQFLSIVNFTLLLITASDKIRYYTNIPRTWLLVVIFVPLGFLGMWMFGLFLDKILRYGQAYNLEAAKRNPVIDEQRELLMRIESAVKRLEQKSS